MRLIAALCCCLCLMTACGQVMSHPGLDVSWGAESSSPTLPDAATAAPAKEGPFTALLKGDFSVLNEPLPMYPFQPQYKWEYTLCDLDGDGKDELFLRSGPSYLVYQEQDGTLLYWDGDISGRADKHRTLLTDGTMVLYDTYSGCAVEADCYLFDFRYQFYRYVEDGQRDCINILYGSWDFDAAPEHGPGPAVRDGYWNDQPLTQEEFEDYLRREMEEKEIRDWTTVHFNKEVSP